MTIRFDNSSELADLIARNPDIKINEDHLTKPDKKAGTDRGYQEERS